MGVEEDISKMKVAELKKALKDRGLAVTGNKQELVERLHEALQCDGAELMEAGDGDDEFDEDEILGGDDKTPQKGGAVLKGQTKGSPSKKKLADKRISLKRSEPPPLTKTDEKAGAKVNGTAGNSVEEDANKENSLEPPKKVLKVVGSESTTESEDGKPKTKLEERAKRFGEVTTEETLKSARASRFGSAADDKKSNKLSTETVKVDVGTLKKRAERFGEVTAKSLSEIDSIEKMKQRQEKFGAVTPEAAKKLDKVPDPSVEAAKVARAERFGATKETEVVEEAKKKRTERFAAK